MKKCVTVWTKQHEDIIETLAESGRHIAKKEYILNDLEEQAPLVLEVYDWLAKNSPGAGQKPPDVKYPIWVSLAQEATMLPEQGRVILELCIDPDIITYVNIEKWGKILNYSYLPENAEDAERHKKLLEQYNIGDAKAYMSQFYPAIKREIIHSWGRLFDHTGFDNSDAYGNIWEIKKEWVTKIIR